MLARVFFFVSNSIMLCCVLSDQLTAVSRLAYIYFYLLNSQNEEQRVRGSSGKTASAESNLTAVE